MHRIKKGALLIDADKLAKRIYKENPEVLSKLEGLFGKEMFDSKGNPVFKALAEKVFSDKTKLEKLNKLMFPLIKRKIKDIININSGREYIIIDAAVLFDCKLDKLCDYIIIVESSLRRRKNFLKQKGFSDYEAELRVRGQHLRINKDKADYIIENNGSKKNLLEKVKEISEKL